MIACRCTRTDAWICAVLLSKTGGCVTRAFCARAAPPQRRTRKQPLPILDRETQARAVSVASYADLGLGLNRGTDARRKAQCWQNAVGIHTPKEAGSGKSPRHNVHNTEQRCWCQFAKAKADDGIACNSIRSSLLTSSKFTYIRPVETGLRNTLAKGRQSPCEIAR